jgi:hypothetical protein
MSSDLGKQLHALFFDGKGRVVPGASTAALGDFHPGDICHDNARNWVSLHPEHRVIHGWLASGTRVFDKHSVIDTGSGLLDVTPRIANANLAFAHHPASTVSFWKCPNQVIFGGAPCEHAGDSSAKLPTENLG